MQIPSGVLSAFDPLEVSMKIYLLLGLLLILPAAVVVLWFLGRPLVALPVLAALLISLVPFLLVIFIIRRQRSR